jgi:RNA-directed DNA polymerase
MKDDSLHTMDIRKRFANIESKTDLISLLNHVQPLVFKNPTNLITLRDLNYFSNHKICKKRYYEFSIQKKDGTNRIINSPHNKLNKILKVLNFIIQCIFTPHDSANGFIKNKSVVHNAIVHTGKNYVFNIDLADFFHSFDRNMVKMAFYNYPFNLKKHKEPLAFLLACLCTHPINFDGEMRIVLPQGSPTSPAISNTICKSLDRQLLSFANKLGANYSRYADDISFSADNNIFQNERFLESLTKIIESTSNLKLNTDKTRLLYKSQQQTVTGLVVNEKVNVKRKYIKNIRMLLYYWERYGYEKANDIFISDQFKLNNYIISLSNSNRLLHHIHGKLLYLRMVKGYDNQTYLKLFQRYTLLCKRHKANEIQSILDDNSVVTPKSFKAEIINKKC